MFTPITPEQRQTIDQVRDAVTGRNEDLFLYSLPDLLEAQKIPPSLAKNCLLFARAAVDDAQQPIITEALTILNKMVDREEDRLLPPSRDMFVGRYFKWDELGMRKDPQSAVLHILNKCTTLLKLSHH